MNQTISIYVRNKDINPSGYYRICQYAKELKRKAAVRSASTNRIYNLTINAPKKSVRLLAKFICEIQILSRTGWYLIMDLFRPPGYLLIQREISPKWQPFCISLLLQMVLKRTTLIWDVDDDIFISKEISGREKRILETAASNIIVTHQALKKRIPQKYWHKIIILPTTDGDIYKSYSETWQQKRIDAIRRGEIVLLWLGSSSGRRFLKDVIMELDDAAGTFQEKGVSLKLLCVTGIPFHEHCRNLTVINKKWSRKTAIKAISAANIGIMPLADETFSEGKGAFKLIQYMAGGLPVIASDVGYNKTVVDPCCGVLVGDSDMENQWAEAIATITGSEAVYRGYCAAAVRKWTEHFNYEHNLDRLNELFGVGEKENHGKNFGCHDHL